MSDIRDSIIKQGIKNLNQFGYKDVTAETILTDEIYSEFFKSMLKDNLGKGADFPINGLLAEIAEKQKVA